MVSFSVAPVRERPARTSWSPHSGRASAAPQQDVDDERTYCASPQRNEGGNHPDCGDVAQGARTAVSMAPVAACAPITPAAHAPSRPPRPTGSQRCGPRRACAVSALRTGGARSRPRGTVPVAHSCGACHRPAGPGSGPAVRRQLAGASGGRWPTRRRPVGLATRRARSPHLPGARIRARRSRRHCKRRHTGQAVVACGHHTPFPARVNRAPMHKAGKGRPPRRKSALCLPVPRALLAQVRLPIGRCHTKGTLVHADRHQRARLDEQVDLSAATGQARGHLGNREQRAGVWWGR